MTVTAPSVEQLAERLQQDPVVIDDRFGNGHTAETGDALRELVAQADVPAYVVLTPPPDGLSGSEPAADLARQLADRLGEDEAIVAVQVGTDGYQTALVGFGGAPGQDEANQASYEHAPNGGSNAQMSPVAVLARDLEAAVQGGEMTSEEWDAYSTETIWAERDWEVLQEPTSAGDAAYLVTIVAVLAAGLALVLARMLPPLVAVHRGRVPASTGAAAGGTGSVTRPLTRSVRDADAPRVRAVLEAALDELADDVAEGLADVDDDVVVQRVRGSQDAARRVADRVGTSPDDLPDLLGALVLARIAAQALADTRHGRSAATPYRACLLDPRHGRAQSERDLPVADRTLAVPVCGGCAQLAADRLRPLRVAPGRLGGARPYLETDSVWARTGYGAFTDELWREVSAAYDGGRA